MSDVLENVPLVTLTPQPIAPSVSIPTATYDQTNLTEVQVTQGSFGAVGHGTLESAISTLPSNLSKTARRGPLQITIALPNLGDEPLTDLTILTGLVDNFEYHYEADSVRTAFRDNGCQLQEITLLPKVLKQLTLGEAVVDIAQQAGFALAFPTSASDLDNLVTSFQANGVGESNSFNPQKIGQFFKDNYYFTAHRKTTWAVLHELAQAFGMALWFTGAGQLYFGPRSTAQTLSRKTTTLKFRNQTQDGTLKSLKVTHQPNRHSFFVVSLTSYERGTGKQTNNACGYVNPQLAKDLSGGVQGPEGVPVFANLPGLYAGFTREELLSALNPNNGTFPVYDLAASGYKPDATLQEAISKAREIQGQEFVIHGTVLPSDQVLQLGDPIQIDAQPFDLLDDLDFTVVEVQYDFNLHDGLVCHFVAWQTAESQISGLGE